MRDSSAAVRDCPIAPPRQASVQSRTLHRACLIVGGVAALARQLDAAEPEVGHWLLGERPIPERIFLQAVEIVLLHASGAGAKS